LVRGTTVERSLDCRESPGAVDNPWRMHTTRELSSAAFSIRRVVMGGLDFEMPACVGPISYRDLGAVHADIANPACECAQTDDRSARGANFVLARGRHLEAGRVRDHLAPLLAGGAATA
jgi:hypothetical protein